MKIVIFGLSITSTWGNGHGNTYRALASALHERGHRIVFFERDLEWYRDNRDLPSPPYCDLRLYDDWDVIAVKARQELRDCEFAVVGSYFPDGHAALELVLESNAEVKTFYDIDTPITMAALREQGATDYLRAEHIPDLDLYLSFTGGPVLQEICSKFGARLAAPLYCSFDPAKYHPRKPGRRFACDLSYMGTYAPDRQPKIDELLCEPARRLPEAMFIVAGSQYPRAIQWPGNVKRITHLNSRWHPLLYSSSRLTLNVTRRDMVLAGYSPSVRLFEAAACGATIVSDNWAGLDSFFVPGSEILLPASANDVVRLLRDTDEAELRLIGQRAAEHVLAEHTNNHRAQELESLLARARTREISTAQIA
jgi:spore maturation protein CgeB